MRDQVVVPESHCTVASWECLYIYTFFFFFFFFCFFGYENFRNLIFGPERAKLNLIKKLINLIKFD